MSTQKKIKGPKLKFNDPVALQKKVDDFFTHCDEVGKPYTVSGLALWLDCTRETILNYEAGNRNHMDENISYTLRKAKLQILNYAEDSLWTCKRTAGVIFNLKNNWGWKDRQEVEQTITTNKNIADFMQDQEEQ